MGNSFPTFYLYGEPHRAASEDFIHVEPLDDRSRPSEWTIRPHAHSELSHVFMIAEGGGSMSADGRELAIAVPALLIVPVGVVHGFVWTSESRGWVATLARSELELMLRGDGDLLPLFRTAAVVPLDAASAGEAERLFGAMLREVGWSRAGRRAAMRSMFEALLVVAVRQASLPAESAQPVSPQARLVARYRQHLEEHVRRRESVGVHAAALGVSESALRAACSAIAGTSPAAMLDQRTVLEARRALVYSSMSVAEIAWALGFADPAYFSRFFARHAGTAPSNWRRPEPGSVPSGEVSGVRGS